MSILTMATPLPHSMFRNDYRWDAAAHSSEYSRTRPDKTAVALPSIRQTFPELHLDGSLPDRPGSKASATDNSPNMTAQNFLPSPDYVASPNWNKRRRISIEDEQSTLRAKQVPRLYRSPERPAPRQLSPTRRDRPLSTAEEAWTAASRPDTYQPGPGVSVPVELSARLETRRGLPSLPPAGKTDMELAKPLDAREHPRSSKAPPLLERTPPLYPSQDFNYSYHHHSRYQSRPTSSVRPYDQAPFSAGGNYSPNYQDVGRYSDLGAMGADANKRKRRGNLPKETTDKLRAWFVAHLQHPYPTEDEKQDLMRQTGLQMNQISNWFINARRRQLPAMINNARAESDAMSGRVGSSVDGDGKILASTERPIGYALPHDKRGGQTLPLSDGEGSSYDEDMGNLRNRSAGEFSRESV